VGRVSAWHAWGRRLAVALVALGAVASPAAVSRAAAPPAFASAAAPWSPAAAPSLSPPPGVGGAATPGEAPRSARGAPAPAPTPALSPEVRAAAQQQLEGLDTSTMQRFVAALQQQLGPGAGFSWDNLGRFLQGEGLLRHPGRLGQALLGVFAGELRANTRLLGELLVLVVFAAVLRQIQGAFEGEVVGRVADAAVFLALGAVCLAGFSLAVRLAEGAVGDLSSFVVALLPALVGLLAATGAPATAGLLSPALLAAVDATGVLVRSLVVPLLLLAALLDVVGAFAPPFRLSSLSGLMRQVGLGAMGLLLTVFLGVVAVQGAAGAVTDGVALRAAKYATRAFVPVVGGLLADTAELVLSSSFLLKSGIGLFGLLSVALLVAVPVMKMMALWAVYRLAAALAQPVGGDAIGQVLGGVAGTLGLLTLAVTAAGLMSFLSLAVFVAAGGAAFALR
jgi:stage III sporulation protein AE